MASSGNELDVVIGGVPRGGTTVAAKLMSLHQDIFCYAGETHLLPFMHAMFGQFPCLKEKVGVVANYLHQQFRTAMVEMPRYSVSKGAHPRNLIFSERDIDELVRNISEYLEEGYCGAELYFLAQGVLREILGRTDHRKLLGEKTPSNLFAMADYAEQSTSVNLVVVREPFGVVRSMRQRVIGGDAYSCAFKGEIEGNIGMYLEYAEAAGRLISNERTLLIRYEDMAVDPGAVVSKMYKSLGRYPDDRIINFVEGKYDREIADRAPVNYKRLSLKGGYGALSPLDVWKICSLTKNIREEFGYSDLMLSEIGYDHLDEQLDVDVPTAVLMLSGFHSSGRTGKQWMRRKGKLIAYVKENKACRMVLTLGCEFPAHFFCSIELSVSVNAKLREVIEIAPCTRTKQVSIHINADDIILMGRRGGYVIVQLESSHSYVQLCHDVDGHDASERSFWMHSAAIKKDGLGFLPSYLKRASNIWR